MQIVFVCWFGANSVVQSKYLHKTRPLVHNISRVRRTRVILGMVQRKILVSGTTQIGYVVLTEHKDVPSTEKLHLEHPDGLEFGVSFVYYFTTANQESERVVNGEEEPRWPKSRDIA